MTTIKKIYFYVLILIGSILLSLNSCEKGDIDDNGGNNEKGDVPVLSTTEITDITNTTATSGGIITDDKGFAVTSRGVCWSTNENPSIRDNKTENGAGGGSFISSINDLKPGTRYYVRSYATNSKGTGYGMAMSFTTNYDPILTTKEITEITHTTATSGGNITDDGGVYITARGVAWSKSEKPSISDSKTDDGEGMGSFTSKIVDLDPNSTYYVRAYATNSVGTVYGNQFVFKTLEVPWRESNEIQFTKIASSPQYSKLSSLSGRGHVMYKVNKIGEGGSSPYFLDKVKVQYTGWYKNNWEKSDSYIDDHGNAINNKVVFDTTSKNNIPRTFSVNDVIDGFSTALQHMKVGDIWEIWVPWELGYGSSGSGSIPGYTTLVFEIELIEIM